MLTYKVTIYVSWLFQVAEEKKNSSILARQEESISEIFQDILQRLDYISHALYFKKKAKTQIPDTPYSMGT